MSTRAVRLHSWSAEQCDWVPYLLVYTCSSEIVDEVWLHTSAERIYHPLIETRRRVRSMASLMSIPFNLPSEAPNTYDSDALM